MLALILNICTLETTCSLREHSVSSGTTLHFVLGTISVRKSSRKRINAHHKGSKRLLEQLVGLKGRSHASDYLIHSIQLILVFIRRGSAPPGGVSNPELCHTYPPNCSKLSLWHVLEALGPSEAPSYLIHCHKIVPSSRFDTL